MGNWHQMETNEIGEPNEEIYPEIETLEPVAEEIYSEGFDSERIVAEETVGEDVRGEIIVDEIENDNTEYLADMDESKVTADLLDRKSIYLESEMKRISEEEASEKNDLDNLI